MAIDRSEDTYRAMGVAAAVRLNVRKQPDPSPRGVQEARSLLSLSNVACRKFVKAGDQV